MYSMRQGHKSVNCGHYPIAILFIHYDTLALTCSAIWLHHRPFTSLLSTANIKCRRQRTFSCMRVASKDMHRSSFPTHRASGPQWSREQLKYSGQQFLYLLDQPFSYCRTQTTHVTITYHSYKITTVKILQLLTPL
jgi:hypothetical protein